MFGQTLWDKGRGVCTSQAQPQDLHPTERSYSDTELTLFSSDYERMRHNKGMIGEGAYGRVEQCVPFQSPAKIFA